MDSPDLPLMASHGYCSQEMVNLLLIGRAASNTFNGKMALEGGGELKGVPERAEVRKIGSGGNKLSIYYV